MLIEPGSQWPPPGHQALRLRWRSWRAWWTGSTRNLARHVPTTVPGGYWHKRERHPEERAVHSALARDIARTSADLVVGDTPSLDWGADKKMQDAWDHFAQAAGWGNTLLEAAETTAALGGVFLVPAWDADIADHAIPTVVPADQALPEFRFGRLRRVAFVRVLPPPAGWTALQRGEVWRHIEHHEPGQVRNELWLGTEISVGRLLPLTDHPSTEDLLDSYSTTAIRPGILVEHWPNILPDPDEDSGMPIGLSDFQGLESLMDCLDEAYSSWMRDIELGKARILASAEMLDAAPQGRSRWFGGRAAPAKVFDEDARVFTPIPGLPADDAGKAAPLTPVEFAIRFEEHRETCKAWIDAIVSRAGYSPQTFGIDVDGQLSGTSFRLRRHRSSRTGGRKRRYARPPIERFAETLALINAVQFGQPKPTTRPTLSWPEGDQDAKELAEVVELLRRAQAASDEVVVRMLHQDWDDDQVQAEVDALADERAIAPSWDGTEPITPGPVDDGPADGGGE
ncbi:hypothetical protein [Actinokineospora enzanensis]|uniref:hypothetical protein n=1 Tax=Actinokineospora enzanensis TaxID=155975 RepID=UPI000362C493|nr:hypothetical protein [Actinokineospora enzanensis]